MVLTQIWCITERESVRLGCSLDYSIVVSSSALYSICRQPLSPPFPSVFDHRFSTHFTLKLSPLIHNVWRRRGRFGGGQWVRYVQGRFRRWRRSSRRLPFHRRSTPSSRSYGRDGTEGLLRRRWSPIQERYVPVLSLLYNAIHSVSRPLYHFVTESLWGVGMGYHPNRPFVADNKSLFSSSGAELFCHFLLLNCHFFHFVIFHFVIFSILSFFSFCHFFYFVT